MDLSNRPPKPAAPIDDSIPATGLPGPLAGPVQRVGRFSSTRRDSVHHGRPADLWGGIHAGFRFANSLVTRCFTSELRIPNRTRPRALALTFLLLLGLID